MARESTEQIRRGLIEAKKSAEAFLTVADKITASFKASGDQISKAAKALDFGASKDIAKVNAQLEKANKLTAERTKLTKESAAQRKSLATINKQLTAQRTKAIDLSKKERIAIQELRDANRENNAEAKLIVRLNKAKAGSIEFLRAKLSFVTIAWKKLTAEELNNTKRGQRLVQSKLQLTNELKKLEKATGDNRRQVGNYSTALGGLRAKLLGVASAAGITVGIFGAFRVLKSSVTLVRNFEKANATLAGVLNQSKDETRELADEAIRLGGITVKTATEITGLQTAFARLGFSQSEILDLTAATIDGSIALNAELGETAELVGAVVNSFDDLSTTDAPRILETLAAATTNSALTFAKLQTALPIVLGAANALDVSLEEVTATLGKLSDSGIETSTSATALRNIFIESAARGIDYKKALELITNSTDKLTTANDIFGKRAAVSALVIANNTENVAELTTELENAKVVQQLVANELDTLDGSLQLLNSAWEAYVLNLNDATSGGNILSDSISFLAENLSTIINLIGITVVSFVAYRVAIAATNAATKVGIVLDNTATIATNLRTIATKAGTAAMKAFNTASRANIIGVLIALLAAAVTAWFAFRDGANEATKAQRRFNEEKKKSVEASRAIINIESKVQKQTIKQLKEQIELRKLQGEDEETLNKEFIKRAKKLLEDRIEVNLFIIQNEQDKSEALKKEIDIRLADLEAEKKTSADIRTGRDVEIRQLEAFNDELDRVKSEETNIFIDANAKLQGNIQERNKIVAELNQQLIDIEAELVKNEIKLTNAQKKALRKRARELDILRRRLEDLRNEAIKDEEARDIKIIKTKFDREIQAIKGFSKVEIALRIELEKRKQREIQEVRDQASEERLNKSREAAQEQIDTINAIEQEQFNGEIARLERLAELEEEGSQARLDILNQANELRRNQLIAQAEFELSSAELTAEQRELIEQQLANDLAAIQDETLKGVESSLKEQTKLYDEALKFIQARFDEFFDRRQDQIDQDLKNTLDAQNRIRRGIQIGNDDAKKSLAAEERRQVELERKKEQTRKNAQRAELAIAALRLLGENADQPNALGKTISDTAALFAFISSLPTFFSGTDSLGKTDSPLDSNGGRLIVAHDDEQIWSQADRGAVGFKTRDQIKDIVGAHERGLLTDSNVSVLSVDQSSLILEVKGLRKSMDTLHNRIPVQSYDYNAKTKQHEESHKYHNKVLKLRTRAKDSWA